MNPPFDPASVFNLADLEALGRAALDPNALDYYASGADDELTLRENRSAYARIRLRPRVLADVSHIDLRTTLLGQAVESPLAVAPTAFHGLAHGDAERATAAAAARAGTVFCLSTFSNAALEEVAPLAGGRLWFQLYLYRDREKSAELVRRAEAAGARALVLTADAPRLGRREANERRRFALPPHLGVPNAGSRAELARLEGESGSQLVRYFQGLIDASFTWEGLGWLCEQTRLPVVIKGILTAEDAALAAERGCHVWVSNHGGRQLDTSVTAIEALPEIVAAVPPACEVYLDGGVRRGTDALKALALGARAVFLGRPVLWGLAAGGSAGAELALTVLNRELELAMALAGAPRLADLSPAHVRLR